MSRPVATTDAFSEHPPGSPFRGDDASLASDSTPTGPITGDPVAKESVMDEPAAGSSESAPDEASLPGWPVRHQTIFHAAVMAAAMVVVAVAASLSVPGTGREEAVVVPGLGVTLPPMCATKILFGLECPGCGMTRSFVSLAHGEFARAWNFNPVGALGFALVIAQIPYRAWQIARLRRGRPAFEHPALNWPVYALLALMAVRMAVVTVSLVAPFR